MSMESRLGRSLHAHSSSYPSSLMSGVTGFSSPIPPRQTQSESGGSNPPSIRSSPRLSPRSSPGLPSKPWKTPQSREGSLERISGPSLGSTPRSEPSPSWIDRLRGHGNQRPWTSSPRRHLVVPEEQTEGYDRIRKLVVHAVSPMLDLAGDVTHEVLVHGTELLKFAPIPGLEGAARVLLAIWDALQQIETNRLASLRLVERCADIFIAIQDEVAGLDKRVTDAVREPMRKLEVAFEEINDMMMNQIHQSSFRRYFKRDEALEDIAICNTKLQDCLGHFDRSIQLRILAYTSGIKESPSGRSDMSLHTKEEIHDHIRKIQERQNDLDRQRDLLDEQNYALALRSNKEVTEVLGVEKADIPAAIKTLLRALEPLRSNHVFDTISFSTSSQRSSTWPISHADSQDLRLRNREAIEQDIRALKAAYGGPVPTLPSWTITKFEIELGDIIGRGFFSTVYRGKWGAHVVAVKVLEVHTSQEAFVDEVNLWKMLKHPNVLELYGASSAEGSMPWFLVSPLLPHGSAADYLKRISWTIQRDKENKDGADSQHPHVDFLGMMYDIAEGMRYLHEQGVLHGDLKAANVLIGDDLHCIVADFGFSKLTQEVQPRNALLNHALRWQAPELMSGESVLTKKVDVYAFAMCCIEILTMGSVPWPMMNDDDVRQIVLDEQGRPPYPENLVRTLKCQNILYGAWTQSPFNRTSFKQLVSNLKSLRDEITTSGLVFTSPRIVVSLPPTAHGELSPRPQYDSPINDASDEDHAPLSPRAEYSTPLVTTLPKLDADDVDVPFVPFDGDDEEVTPLENSLLITFDGPSTKPPSTIKEDDGATVKERYEDQFEFTYRMCLSHEFPRQLNIPIWSPCDVELGDVGYLTFGGHFVKLFNAIEPLRSSGGRIKIPGIGKVSCVDRQQKENIVLKGFKAISKLVSPGESSLSEGFKRRHTFSLAGERTAFLCAEKTRHRYIEDSRPCKKWFRAYWQDILHEYGEEHVLQKDDLVLILETLSAQNYALFANHGHASSDAHFDVLASPGVNEPWGSFILPPDQPNAPPRLLHSKVSIIGSPSKTILITRLRFRPDVEEPTIRD